jgi:hypothetical protein
MEYWARCAHVLSANEDPESSAPSEMDAESFQRAEHAEHIHHLERWRFNATDEADDDKWRAPIDDFEARYVLRVISLRTLYLYMFSRRYSVR